MEFAPFDTWDNSLSIITPVWNPVTLRISELQATKHIFALFQKTIHHPSQSLVFHCTRLLLWKSSWDFGKKDYFILFLWKSAMFIAAAQNRLFLMQIQRTAIYRVNRSSHETVIL